MQLNYNHIFKNFPYNSRVWVYLSSRELLDSEKDIIKIDLENFIENWSTHGKKLKADFLILYNFFILFIVDENITAISGCSIDKSVQIMKKIGDKINVDFFNRMNVLTVNENKFEITNYNKIKKLESASYFNPVVNSLEDLRLNWFKTGN